MMRTLLAITILTIFLIGIQAISAPNEELHSWRSKDWKPGYAETINPDEERTGEILYVVEDPYKNEIKFSEKMFDPTLRKDIILRYQERFGRTEVEIIQARTPYLNSNFSEGESITFNEEEYQKQQQSFGNYIAKRLVEYHFEKEAKSNPSLKGAYEAKQTIENASASVGKFKIRARYRLASNSILTYIKNPYVDIQARFELSGDRETVYSVSKNFSNSYSFLTDYYLQKSRWDIIGRKGITSNLSVSLTYSPFREIEVEEKANIIVVKERLALVGLSYIF